MDASLAGLSAAEARRRQAEVGRNEIESRDSHSVLQTLRSVASEPTRARSSATNCSCTRSSASAASAPIASRSVPPRRAWAAAARRLGLDADVHTGRPVENPWSRRICFAGLGAGEVIVGPRKLVGISQRRTREGARFQCVVHRAWDPVPLLGLLALDDLERAYGLAQLADVATGLDADTAVIVEALVASLPA